MGNIVHDWKTNYVLPGVTRVRIIFPPLVFVLWELYARRILSKNSNVRMNIMWLIFYIMSGEKTVLVEHLSKLIPIR